MRLDLFHRLPPPMAIFLLSSILKLASAYALHIPQQTPPPTTTLPHHALDVVSWPLVPTSLPLRPPRGALDLLRRQDLNTICGYIGGELGLPATCSAGSHCVVDVNHSVVGCCPNGHATCTAGVFTSCVDANSSPQTEVNPYVYTCKGSNVCYKNHFDGGYSQFGCGTASDMATTVLASASGATGPLTRPTISISFTHTPSSLSSTSSVKSTQRSSSSSASSTPSRSTDPAQTAAPAGGAGMPGNDKIGPIVGGTIGGVAVLIAVIALAFFFLRQRRANARRGPEGGPEKLIIPPQAGGGNGFTPVHQSNEGFESGLPPVAGGVATFSNDLSAGGPSPFAYHGAAGTHTSYPPAEGYHYPGQYPAAYAGVAPAGIVGAPVPPPKSQARGANGHRHGHTESDQVPLTREIDEFSQGYQQALGRIGEEDESSERLNTGTTSGGDLSEGRGVPEGSGSRGGPRPLWQQNRRQSRNQMWM